MTHPTLLELFDEAMTFDEEAIKKASFSVDLARFRGKFETEGVELVARMVACSKAEGAKAESERRQPIDAAVRKCIEALQECQRDRNFEDIIGQLDDMIDDALVDLRKALEEAKHE